MAVADSRDDIPTLPPDDPFATIDPSQRPVETSPVKADETMHVAPASAADMQPKAETQADVYGTLVQSVTDAPRNVPPPPPLLPFDRVGDYDVLEKIGVGGMGLVLKARHKRLKRTVAIKLMKLGQLAEENDIARFLVEARAAARLKHPNIVPVYDVGEHEGSPFFSMEYVEGNSLHKLIGERPLVPRRAATIAGKIASALEYAHEAGILHRDVKPHNILIDPSDEPKITDFGLAANADENSQLTATGTVLGTPSYMPPEQARGRHAEMGRWSDVYSLGATLYEMLTGRAPFAAATLAETLRQVLDAEPVAPRGLNPSIPKDLETICLKCLEKDPQRRYATAKLLAEDLQRYLDDVPILARPTSRWDHFRRWCRRNPLVASSIAATVLALFIALGSVTWSLIATQAALKETQEFALRATHIVDNLVARISEETLLDQPGLQPLRADIQKQALKEYESLLTMVERNKQLPEQIAMVKFGMGEIKQKLKSPSEALPLYEQAINELNVLQQRDPKNTRLLNHQALVETQIGKLHYIERQLDKAGPPLQRARASREKLVEIDPRNVEFGQLLANADMNLGLLEQALDHFDTARERYEAAQARRIELLRIDPENAGVQRDYAKGLSNLGMLLAMQRKLDEAEAAFQKSQVAFQTLSERKDRKLDDLHDLAVCWRRLGDTAAIRNGKDDLRKADRCYVEGIQVLVELVQANYAVQSYRGTLAAARMNLATLRERQNDPHGAFALLTEALDEFQKLKADNPAYKKYAAKSLHEMLRLQHWKKLEQAEQESLKSWLDFATEDYGEPWVQSIQKLAEAAPEFPQALSLEESEILHPASRKQ